MMAMTAMGQNFTQNLDPSVRPGDDFYEYAAGGWMLPPNLKPGRNVKF